MTRKAIHAYLSPEAHSRWHDFAAEEGVSVSALLEAIAEEWGDRRRRGEPVYGDGEDVLTAARQVDAARRRRKRD